MAEARFLQILFCTGIGALRFLADQVLRLAGRYAQIDYAIFTRKIVDFVFQVANPAPELIAFLRRYASGLVREVGAYVAIDQDDFARAERGFDSVLGFETVAGVQKC